MKNPELLQMVQPSGEMYTIAAVYSAAGGSWWQLCVVTAEAPTFPRRPWSSFCLLVRMNFSWSIEGAKLATFLSHAR